MIQKSFIGINGEKTILEIPYHEIKIKEKICEIFPIKSGPFEW